MPEAAEYVDSLYTAITTAGTKGNDLPFRPALVGGHCIGVDPYYLTHKAQEVGHHPPLILAGRRTNDDMGPYVADQVIKLMLRKGINPVSARILVFGLTFNENCPDIRNTRVVDIIETLEGPNAEVDVYDPWACADEARPEPIGELSLATYDTVVPAVAHREFAALGAQGIRALTKPESIVYDVKHVLPKQGVDGRL